MWFWTLNLICLQAFTLLVWIDLVSIKSLIYHEKMLHNFMNILIQPIKITFLYTTILLSMQPHQGITLQVFGLCRVTTQFLSFYMDLHLIHYVSYNTSKSSIALTLPLLHANHHPPDILRYKCHKWTFEWELTKA